jgi:hypothetical protein
LQLDELSDLEWELVKDLIPNAEVAKATADRATTSRSERHFMAHADRKTAEVHATRLRSLHHGLSALPALESHGNLDRGCQNTRKSEELQLSNHERIHLSSREVYGAYEKKLSVYH